MDVRVFFWLKYRLHHKLPHSVWFFFSSKISKFRDKKYLEKAKSFGNLNPDLTFYVIRRRPPGWGFFSNILFVCQGILYARNNGYIPVVDMQNYWIKELSSLKAINGTYNAWCYFFDQPSKVSLEEVYRSKNVILSDGSAPMGRDHAFSVRTRELIDNPVNLQLLREIVTSSIILNEPINQEIESRKKLLMFTPQNTLAVFIRGTVYFNDVTKSGFSVPDLEYFLRQVSDTLVSNSIKKLFIVTEDYRIYNIMLQKFREYDIVRSIRFENNLSESEWLKSQQTSFDGGVIMGYDKTLVYLAEAILLSSCHYFIGTYSNLSAFVLASSDLSKGEHKIVLKNRVITLTNL
jgi:hypothetical protein